MKVHRHCDELGVCQRRNPPCNGCVFRPAPGVVEGPFSRQRNGFARSFMGMLVKWGSVTAVAGIALGYLWSKGQLL